MPAGEVLRGTRPRPTTPPAPTAQPSDLEDQLAAVKSELEAVKSELARYQAAARAAFAALARI